MLLLFPLLIPICAWWKRYVYPAFEIPVTVYENLGKLLKGSSLRNVAVTIIDNTFDEHKAHIIYEIISGRSIKGLTFVNFAGSYNFRGREYSDFDKNMRPIRELRGLISDVRWPR